MKKNLTSISIFILIAVFSLSTIDAATTMTNTGSFNASTQIGGGTQGISNQGGLQGISNQGGGTQGISRPSNNGGISQFETARGSSGVPELSLKGIVSWLGGLMNNLIYLIIGASLVVFLYGILRLSFVDGQKPEAREQARKFMFWGIVSLFVMVSVWGLVTFLQNTFFGGSPLTIPTLK